MRKIFFAGSSILALALLTAFNSCINKTRQNTDPLKISIDLGNDLTSINPDSIFESVKYIPLETTHESLIYEINKIVYIDNIYYILDKKQAVIYKFDKEGKYLDKLSNRGYGPEEYISLDDFFITNDSLLYILSSGNRQIKIYNTRFEYKKTFDTKTYCSQMEYLNENIFLYCNFYSHDLKNIYVIDRFSGEIKKRHRDFKRKQLGTGYSNTVFSKNQDCLYAFFPFDFNLYVLNENNLERHSCVDFGENQVSETFLEYSDDERKEYIKTHYSNMCEVPIFDIDHFYISDNSIYLNFIHNCLSYFFLLYKKNNISYMGYILMTEKFPYANSELLSINNNQMIMISYSENILEAYKENKLQGIKIDVPEVLINNLKIDDNPVLCIYTFKA